jgi:hypothetical protein
MGGINWGGTSSGRTRSTSAEAQQRHTTIASGKIAGGCAWQQAISARTIPGRRPARPLSYDGNQLAKD